MVSFISSCSKRETQLWSGYSSLIDCGDQILSAEANDFRQVSGIHMLYMNHLSSTAITDTAFSHLSGYPSFKNGLVLLFNHHGCSIFVFIFESIRLICLNSINSPSPMPYLNADDA